MTQDIVQNRTPPVKRRRWILDPSSQEYIPPAFTPHVASLHRVWQVDDHPSTSATPFGLPSAGPTFVPATDAVTLTRTPSRESCDPPTYRVGVGSAADVGVTSVKARSGYATVGATVTPANGAAALEIVPDLHLLAKVGATAWKDQTWLMRQLLGALPSRRRKAVGVQREIRVPLENKASMGPPHVQVLPLQ